MVSVKTVKRMESCIRKWGNSLALRIPQTLARQMNVQVDCRVSLTLHGANLIVSPIRRPPVRLEDLLEGVRTHNRHAESATGAAYGEESW